MQPSRTMFRRALSLEKSPNKFKGADDNSDQVVKDQIQDRPKIGPRLKQPEPLNNIKPVSNYIEEDPQIDEEKIISIPFKTSISNP
jgi:hypothetical protein